MDVREGGESGGRVVIERAVSLFEGEGEEVGFVLGGGGLVALGEGFLEEIVEGGEALEARVLCCSWEGEHLDCCSGNGGGEFCLGEAALDAVHDAGGGFGQAW